MRERARDTIVRHRGCTDETVAVCKLEPVFELELVEALFVAAVARVAATAVGAVVVAYNGGKMMKLKLLYEMVLVCDTMRKNQ